jgi:3-methyladenine DNA glycosylase/8-oxoguanine DNA glycosylase
VSAPALAAGAAPSQVREWRPDYALDVRGLLSPLRRGVADPTIRFAEGGAWRTTTTADGPATLLLQRRGDGTVVATAWGPGAERVLAGVPALLGAGDRPEEFTAHHPLVADALRRMPGLRLGSTGRVWDVLLAAVLEQKVTGTEAHRSWRELCRRFGDPAPGPAPDGMRVPPTPAQLRAVPDWEWHRAGVDHARGRALRASATVAHRLERACELGGTAGRELLRRVQGIGVWTAAEVAQRAWGDPDAVSFGDFHIAKDVGWAVTGTPYDDEQLRAFLEPWRPQRNRAVVLIHGLAGGRPRRGPRLAPRTPLPVR